MDTSGHFGDSAVFRAAVETFSADNVLLGTDFPYETRTGDDFRRIVDAIEDVTSAQDADKVLGQNALDLLVNVP